MIKSWIHLLTIHLSSVQKHPEAITRKILIISGILSIRLSLEVLAHGFTFEFVKTPFQQLSLDCQAKGNHDMSSMLCMLVYASVGTWDSYNWYFTWSSNASGWYLPSLIAHCHLFNSYTVYITFPTPWVFGRSLNFFNSICRSKTSRRLATSASLPYIPSLTSGLSASLSWDKYEVDRSST